MARGPNSNNTNTMKPSKFAPVELTEDEVNAQMMIEACSSARRNAITTNTTDRPRIPYVDLERLERGRTQVAAEDNAQLSAWANLEVSDDEDGPPQPENIAYGQAHRLRLSSQLQSEVLDSYTGSSNDARNMVGAGGRASYSAPAKQSVAPSAGRVTRASGNRIRNGVAVASVQLDQQIQKQQGRKRVLDPAASCNNDDADEPRRVKSKKRLAAPVSNPHVATTNDSPGPSRRGGPTTGRAGTTQQASRIANAAQQRAAFAATQARARSVPMHTAWANPSNLAASAPYDAGSLSSTDAIKNSPLLAHLFEDAKGKGRAASEPQTAATPSMEDQANGSPSTQSPSHHDPAVDLGTALRETPIRSSVEHSPVKLEEPESETHEDQDLIDLEEPMRSLSISRAGSSTTTTAPAVQAPSVTESLLDTPSISETPPELDLLDSSEDEIEIAEREESKNEDPGDTEDPNRGCLLSADAAMQAYLIGSSAKHLQALKDEETFWKSRKGDKA